MPDLLGIKAINDNWGTGIRVALDDVSHVGGANLALLARCNVDIIKIDKSLVSQINAQCPALEWLAGIAGLLGSSQLN